MQQISSDTLAAKRWRLALARFGLPEDATVNELIEVIEIVGLGKIKAEVEKHMAEARERAVQA